MLYAICHSRQWFACFAVDDPAARSVSRHGRPKRDIDIRCFTAFADVDDAGLFRLGSLWIENLLVNSRPVSHSDALALAGRHFVPARSQTVETINAAIIRQGARYGKPLVAH